MSTFAITGVGGYIAPKHIEAIKYMGGTLVAALDPHDSVGRLDQFGYYVKYFTDFERFERFLELRRATQEPIDYLVVCSPNYLHDCHIRLGMRTCGNVICEKPVVIKPYNLDAIVSHPDYKPGRVSTILQLRLMPQLVEFRENLLALIAALPEHDVLDLELTYITARGEWYDHSWKGDESKSGGLPMNIGVHLFDMLCWMLGDPEWVNTHLTMPRRWSGAIRFKRAMVRWFLSVEIEDVKRAGGTGTSVRRLDVNRETGHGRNPYRLVERFDFNEGFADLHKASYQAILNGHGFSVEDSRPAIELVHNVRTKPIGSALWHHGMRHLFK